ncbi:hypothetical protein KF707_22465 [Candidatus Obscuribacterales bacterium]|nr:hypothetical protein [Candidatus Obscuribacterales bacterium]
MAANNQDNQADFLSDIDRGDLLGVVDRQSRRVVASLLARGVLRSGGDREPVSLAFPIQAAASWFPGLFPPNDPTGGVTVMFALCKA